MLVVKVGEIFNSEQFLNLILKAKGIKIEGTLHFYERFSMGFDYKDFTDEDCNLLDMEYIVISDRVDGMYTNNYDIYVQGLIRDMAFEFFKVCIKHRIPFLWEGKYDDAWYRGGYTTFSEFMTEEKIRKYRKGMILGKPFYNELFSILSKKTCEEKRKYYSNLTFNDFFWLINIEGLTTTKIAELFDIKSGSVATKKTKEGVINIKPEDLPMYKFSKNEIESVYSYRKKYGYLPNNYAINLCYSYYLR